MSIEDGTNKTEMENFLEHVMKAHSKTFMVVSTQNRQKFFPQSEPVTC